MAGGNNKTFSISKTAKECKFSVECFVAFDASITHTHTQSRVQVVLWLIHE